MLRARRLQLALVASFVASAALPLLGRSPLGTLSPHLTDHARHPYLVWIAAHRGAEVYTTSLGELAPRVPAYPHPVTEWSDVAYMYPPAALLFYAPVSALGAFAPVTHQQLGIAAVLYLLVFAHLGIWAVLRVLEQQPPGARVVVGALAWVVLVHLALQGQYDVAWIACAAVALRFGRDDPARALRWITLAALLHFRAAILAPLAVFLLVRGVSWSRPRQWPWPTLIAGFAAAIVCAWCALSAAPLARADHAPLYSDLGSWRVWATVALSAGAVLLAARWSNGVVAATVAIGFVLALVDIPHWWHASMMLVAPLAAGAAVPGAQLVPETLVRARLLLVGWYVAMQVLVFGGNPLWLFRDVTRYLM